MTMPPRQAEVLPTQHRGCAGCLLSLVTHAGAGSKLLTVGLCHLSSLVGGVWNVGPGGHRPHHLEQVLTLLPNARSLPHTRTTWGSRQTTRSGGSVAVIRGDGAHPQHIPTCNPGLNLVGITSSSVV